MYKIGEVANKTGISIRSLRHYDEIELLQPSCRNVAGYRLYGKDDIMRLQQIVSLKQMGFSLKKIGEMLDQEVSLKDTLGFHLEYIESQLLKQKVLYQHIKHLHDLMINKKNLSVDIIYQTMENIKMYEQYYSKEQIEQLKKRSFHMDHDSGAQYSRAWSDVFSGLLLLQQQQMPAEDDRTKPFAQRAMELKALFIGGDTGIESSLDSMYKEVGGGQMLRNHGLDVSDELYEYYSAVLKAHIKKGS